MRTAMHYLFGFSLLVLVFPAALPPVLTVLSAFAFGVGFWFWLYLRKEQT